MLDFQERLLCNGHQEDDLHCIWQVKQGVLSNISRMQEKNLQKVSKHGDREAIKAHRVRWCAINQPERMASEKRFGKIVGHNAKNRDLGKKKWWTCTCSTLQGLYL